VFRRLACLLLALISTGAPSAFAQAANRPISAIGEFSNMRYTEEHAYGYAVELWRDGGSIIGLFLAAEGPQGDSPTGMLENIKFNSHTGALSFTAKLTIGVAFLPGWPAGALERPVRVYRHAEGRGLERHAQAVRSAAALASGLAGRRPAQNTAAGSHACGEFVRRMETPGRRDSEAPRPEVVKP